MRFELHTDDALNITNITNDIDFVCIDPPYGIHKMGSEWCDTTIRNEITKSTGVVKGLPRGMKFDIKSSKNIGDFIYHISCNIIEVMKPGSFCVVFSQPRSSHRVGIALEDAGFELRDQLIWEYGNGQCKAQGMQNFIRKSKDIPINDKEELINTLNGMKTPQLMPSFEVMWLCQKPKDGTFVNNYIKYNTGLVDFREGVKNTIFSYKKPNKDERLLANKHPTQKPVSLIEHLIKLFCPKHGVVLDCFCGSGTTGVACIKTNRSFVGVDKSKEWIDTTRNRLLQENDKSPFF